MDKGFSSGLWQRRLAAIRAVGGVYARHGYSHRRVQDLTNCTFLQQPCDLILSVEQGSETSFADEIYASLRLSLSG